MRKVLMVIICLGFASLGRAQTQATVQNTPYIQGRWFMNGDPNKPCEIRQDGNRHFLSQRGSFDFERSQELLQTGALQNPKLKALREMHGTVGETSCALVDSPAWKWTKDFRIDAKGLERTKPRGGGNRMLGLCVEGLREPADGNQLHSVTLMFLNAGGAANGPALGGAAIRYLARAADKGWTVELSEALDP